MTIIRQAVEGDLREIRRILDELDLDHPSLSLGNFHVAEAGGRIVGVTHLENRGPALYLSAVGVKPELRLKGVARLLIESILSLKKKDAYVYTRIPDFFSKLEFSFSDAPALIPPQSIYDCEKCDGREKCVCMMRKQNAATVS